jgi:hypothetical protein
MKPKRPRYRDGTPKIPKQACLRCGYEVDAATATFNKKTYPGPGDVSLCLNCGHAMQFSPAMLHMEISEAEWREIRRESPEIIAMMAKAKRYAVARGDLRKGRA